MHPTSRTPLDRMIESDLNPMRLPDDARQFWRLLDKTTVDNRLMAVVLHNVIGWARGSSRSSCKGWVCLALALFLCDLATPVDAVSTEIAILKSSDLIAYNDAIKGFKATAPGTVTYVEFDLRGDLEQGKQLARKIRTADFSLVVAVGLKAGVAAKLEIVDIPILYMMIPDPMKHRLTTDNMTGMLLDIPPDRQFTIMRTLLPTLQRIGVLYDPSKSLARFQDAVPQAANHNFQLQGFAVRSEKEIPQQLRALLSDSDVLWLIPDSTVLTDESLRFILESALSKQIPVIGFSSELTRIGALLSVSISYVQVGRETGLLAKRILDGEKVLPLKPAPIQRVRVTANLKTARYLGITIPKELDSLIDETY